MKISVVSPVYMAENIIEELVKRLSDELKLLTSDFEIILVDDCGPDDSWNEIQKQCKLNSYVKGIKLSRNFGQHNAVSAGLEFAKGNIIVLMDCDLQDDPRHIKTLLEYYEKGNEIVFTKRIARKHNFFKNVSAKIYNAIFNILSDKNFDLKVGSLVIFSEKVKNEYINLKEHDKLYIQGLKWLGFKHTYVSVEHRERHSGASSYTLPKLINIAIQGWVSNSEKLLHLSIKIGFFFLHLHLLLLLDISFTTHLVQVMLWVGQV
jgi:dolichol-phosphate mannosyltransferase